MKNIAIFASGTGTNAEQIIRHFRSSDSVQVALVLCNKPDAPVLEKAARLNVAALLLNKTEFNDARRVLPVLEEHKIDLIVLAGFLLFVPDFLTANYPQRIINIHPSLLPKHGGHGMYGLRVHQAVIDAHETQSGITIHYVNEQFDAGQVIFQTKCPVLPDDTAETLAARVHLLEYKWYPDVVEKILLGQPIAEK